MSEINYCTLDSAEHCITCSGEALPAKVLKVDDLMQLALVAVGEETTEVDISLVDIPTPGDWLLVHGGVALSALESSPHE